MPDEMDNNNLVNEEMSLLKVNHDDKEPAPSFWSKYKIWVRVATAGILIIVLVWLIWLAARPEEAPIEVDIAKSDQSPQTGYSGRIYLSSETDRVMSGQEFILDILGDTNGANLVAVNIKLYFDSEKVKVLRVDNTQSVLSIKAIQNIGDNYIEFVRGEPGDGNPEDEDDGFTGKGGILSRVVFKAIIAGDAIFYLDKEETQAAVDDGKGTMMKLAIEDVKVMIE